jgi:hypothetical protein
LWNRFLATKQNLLKSGEIVQETFTEYKQTTDRSSKMTLPKPAEPSG